MSCLRLPPLLTQEHTNRDPDLTVLWSTKEWAAWPRGVSKAAARLLCDPLVFFTAFVPIFVLGFNTAWPHRVGRHSLRSRLMYIAARLMAAPCLLAALVFITGTTRTHLLVSHLPVVPVQRARRRYVTGESRHRKSCQPVVSATDCIRLGFTLKLCDCAYVRTWPDWTSQNRHRTVSCVLPISG
jgi:hypothetical protein